jgi:16S rRNA (cytidine1402-2'-O)-methyltransferase
LLEKLRNDARIAMVSDAGTPLVSDPGYRLVADALAEGIRVEPIPGPSAVLAALAASGLPTDAFHFGGFLPARSSPRRKALAVLKDEPATLVFFEAPHRIRETLTDIEEVLGPRPVVLARELTKIHEQFLRGTPAELLHSDIPLKGEFTLLIGKSAGLPQDDTPVADAIAARVSAGMSRMEAIKSVARDRGLSKREVYRLTL